MSKYAVPPQGSGQGPFDNLVGLQMTKGGGLTLANFDFSSNISEKVNRNFDTGTFSKPFTLSNLNIVSLESAAAINDINFKVYPNFDETDVLNFVGYGSLAKRFSAAILNIINHFPAGVESNLIKPDFTTGYTATNIYYDIYQNTTFFQIDASKVVNPFSVDFTKTSTINISSLEFEVSKYRDFTKYFSNYSIFVSGNKGEDSFSILNISATTTITAGTLSILARGNVFYDSSIINSTNTTNSILIRPNDFTVNEVFNLELDEIEEILLNRYTTPKYTAYFKVLSEGEDGNEFYRFVNATWNLDGAWNIDIRTPIFTKYIATLDIIAKSYDEESTDLLSRFYTTDAFKEFDTPDHKVDKTLKIYGRSFDESKKYIDSISHMVSVNYNVGNDVPSKLLPNFAETIGWQTNISPIQSDSFLSTLYATNAPQFPGMDSSPSSDELEFQYYRNLIMNSAYLFKSKGTRRAIEFLMSNIGAPEALIEFNENVYLADGNIPISKFEDFYFTVTGGTFSPETPILDANNTYSFNGVIYSAYTSSTSVIDVNITLEDYPIDSQGYPKPPINGDNFYFQKGSGWFETTTQHRSPEIVNTSTSVFTGNSVSIQTALEPFTYGQKYLDRFINFPYLNIGFELERTVDNKKSWSSVDESLRKNSDGNYDAYYQVSDDRLVINVKNVDLFLNPAQALAYDVWYLSNIQNYPIPYTGLSFPYPSPNDGGLRDDTVVDPKPQIKDFFEFYNTFWKNLINVRNRQGSWDGKTSGYPTLQRVYWKYLTMYDDVGKENNNFSYKNMIKYINGLGDYWIRLIEQFIPATTIWNTGLKIENSIFHRQKYVYRINRNCETTNGRAPLPIIKSGILPKNCNTTNINIGVIYSLNNIQSGLASIQKTISCKKGTSTITSLSYGFTLSITKQGVTTDIQYSNKNIYYNPNLTPNESEWNTMLNQGVGYIMNDVVALGISIMYDNGNIILESQDCIQIDSGEFTLEYINVITKCI